MAAQWLQEGVMYNNVISMIQDSALKIVTCNFHKKCKNKLDVCGSVHHSIIHKDNPTSCNSVSKFLFHIYIKLNMFRATHRPSSGAQNCTSSLWFRIRERLLDVEVAGR
jgi:hypothetical protein